ncbi:MAG: ABC transporter permease, partial [Gemmatimonadota bacterium]
MIDTRWRKMGRDLWLHRTRSATVVLAILVGLVAAGAVLDTWALLRRVTRDGYLATNPASATLHLADGDSVDAALLAAVRAHPGVRDAQARRTVVASALVDGSWRPALLFTAPALDAQRIGALAREDGAWPPAAGDFTVERSSQDFAGIAIGDSVALRVGEGAPLRLPVTGVARDAGLAPGWMEHVVYGFVAPATLSRLGVGAGMNQLQIVGRDAGMDRAAVRRLAIALREVAEGTGHTVRAIDVPEPGEHIHAAQMNSLLLVKGAFGLLALILSGFLVVNLVTALLAGQLREIGVMKAIGARPRQLATMYLALAVVLGLMASAVAIPTAALIGRAYGRFSAELLNFSIEGYAIPRWALAVQLTAGILLPLAAAAIPVARGSRIPVAAALRDAGVGDGGVTPPWIDRVRGARRPLLLSLRNAFRRRQRMALTLLTLALGGATFLGALDLRQSIRDSVGHLYGEMMRFDMSVRLDAPQPAARAELVARGLGGVEAA